MSRRHWTEHYREIRDDLTASNWLRHSLSQLMDRDPVDCLADSETLMQWAHVRADEASGYGDGYVDLVDGFTPVSDSRGLATDAALRNVRADAAALDAIADAVAGCCPDGAAALTDVRELVSSVGRDVLTARRPEPDHGAALALVRELRR